MSAGVVPQISDAGRADMSERVARLDWKGIATALDEDGFSVAPAFLAPTECASLAEVYADDDRFRFAIRAEDGSTSWEQVLPAGEIRERLQQGVVLFLVDSSSHPAGRYVLTMRPATGDAREPLLEIPFEIGSPPD